MQPYNKTVVVSIIHIFVFSDYWCQSYGTYKIFACTVLKSTIVFYLNEIPKKIEVVAFLAIFITVYAT